MPGVTGWRATLPTTRWAWLLGRRTGGSTGGRLRTVVRRAPRLFPQLLILNVQPPNFCFQGGHPLQHLQQHPLDTGRRQRPILRSTLNVG